MTFKERNERRAQAMVDLAIRGIIGYEEAGREIMNECAATDRWTATTSEAIDDGELAEEMWRQALDARAKAHDQEIRESARRWDANTTDQARRRGS